MKKMKVLTAAWLSGLAMGAWISTPSATDAAALQVDYDPPRLSVEATEVGLAEVLGAIGAKVGFTVVPSNAPSVPVTVSMHDVPVDDALRRLLRSENHTILYRQGADSAALVDRIVLLGPPGQPSPAPAIASQTPAMPAGRPVSGQPSSAAPGGASEAAGGPHQQAPGEDPVTVSDMLRTQALAGVPPQAPALTAAPAPQDVAPSAEETLAVTTRRAQQGLSSLVESLERATQALQQQQATPPTAGH